MLDLPWRVPVHVSLGVTVAVSQRIPSGVPLALKAPQGILPGVPLGTPPEVSQRIPLGVLLRIYSAIPLKVPLGTPL